MILIEGMQDGHCVNAITEALQETKRIRVHGVAIGQALVQYGMNFDRHVLIEAIEKLGYTVIEKSA